MWGLNNLENSIEKEMLSLITDVKLQSYQERFNQLDESGERMDFIYSLLKKSPLFIDTVKKEFKKSNDISMEHRKRGNNLYIRDKKMLEALESYTQSIIYAENGSSFLGIAYANRSAVLFEKAYYKECLEDIERALQNNYPDNLKEKLLKRKEKAENLMASQMSVCHYYPAPTISHKNPLITAASNSVEIRKNKKFGRHIIATKNIRVGDVISAENSFVHVIHPESRFIHCHECLDVCYNMIPCERCPALYCSENCLQKAFNNYHKYECDLISLFHKYPQLFIRLTIKGLKEHENVGDANFEAYNSDRFKEIGELATNENQRDFINTCVHLTTVCVSYHSLIESPNFKNDFDIATIDGLLKDLLYRTYMIHSFNPFNIKKIKYTLGDVKSKKVGTAVYAFTSLFNHACVPNCEFFHHGTVLVTRAMANIKKGDQCTICYGISFSTTEINYRRRILKRNYLFDCECEACVKKWPQFNQLPLGRPIPLWFEEKIAANSFEDTEANRKLLNEVLEDALRLYNSLEKYEPCQNLLRVQDLITELYSYMAYKHVDF